MLKKGQLASFSLITDYEWLDVIPTGVRFADSLEALEIIHNYPDGLLQFSESVSALTYQTPYCSKMHQKGLLLEWVTPP